MVNLKKLIVKILKANPVGTIEMYAGATAPTGWLICDGASKNKNEYPALFAIIGYTYGGSGDTFNLPDMRNRVPVGAGDSYGLNAEGGNNSVSYTPTGTNEGTKLEDKHIAHGHSFTQPKIPNHKHSFTQPTISVNTNGSVGEKEAFRTGAMSQNETHSHSYDLPIGTSGSALGLVDSEQSGSSGTPHTATASVAHTHMVPKHAHTFTDPTYKASNGAVGNPSSLPSCTGGAVADLYGASSTRTTHTHTFTGTQASINVRQPYRGINFIIYAGI